MNFKILKQKHSIFVIEFKYFILFINQTNYNA